MNVIIFSLEIRVKRNAIFDESFLRLSQRTIEDWKRKLTIEFSGEEGVDAGLLILLKDLLLNLLFIQVVCQENGS